MEGFTLIDGVVAAVIVLSALLAYGRGLVREAMAIAGWVVAAIVAFLFAPQVQPLVKEIPVVGEFVADSCVFSLGGAFALVMVAALIVMSLFTPLFSSLVQRSALGGVDQGLGFLFGVVRGVLLVAIAFFVYNTMGQQMEMVDTSRSAVVFAQFNDTIADQNPEAVVSWFETQYDQLLAVCE